MYWDLPTIGCWSPNREEEINTWDSEPQAQSYMDNSIDFQWPAKYQRPVIEKLSEQSDGIGLNQGVVEEDEEDDIFEAFEEGNYVIVAHPKAKSNQKSLYLHTYKFKEGTHRVDPKSVTWTKDIEEAMRFDVDEYVTHLLKFSASPKHQKPRMDGV